MALKVKQYGVYTTVPKHKGTENFKIKVLGKKWTTQTLAIRCPV